MKVPDRKLVPDDPPEPVAQCWYCNEDIWPDRNNDIEILEGAERSYTCCMSDKCVKAIGIEEGWDKEYIEMEDDYTFADYCKDQYWKSEHIMTEEDYQLLQVEEVEEQKHNSERGLL